MFSRPTVADGRHVKDTGGIRTPNLWDQVGDFQWMKSGPSPNWNILQDDDERALGKEVWKEFGADGSSHLTLEEMLSLVKIPQ